ncbi:hypothetical protein CHS0354_008594 [Potamilus streckersoni]|uniref:Charged multivesicular body protein 6 n=1 Tax=Potamilus streckersoni TaxID=2493646 RepID=A0AAE0SVA2_9BIVA|nr:hypothetical protein CHS0354_008594 [Potamilus streckersoni]
MGNLFGKGEKKKPPSRITEQDKAVLQLKQQRDKVKQYQKKIAVQIQKDREVAKLLLRDGKKEKAKLLLRKKKFQETQIEKMDGQLDNIERMVHDLEFAQIESQVIQGLKIGNDSLKKMHEILSLEDVEKIMDETKEAVEYQQEIDDLLAGGLTQQDEDDVLAELDSIVKHTLPEVPEDEMPEVLQEKPAAKEKAKEKRKAEAMLAS